MRRTLGWTESAFKLTLIFVVALPFLAGCSLGPMAFKGNRLAYNISLQKSDNEVLLLNIVRLKYLQTPFFLQVGSISASFGYSANVGMGAILQDKAAEAAVNSYTPNIGAAYSENPTIIYTPLQGEAYVTRMLREITMGRFLLLARSGWSMLGIMRIMVKRIGNLNNYTPDVFVQRFMNKKEAITSYKKFLRLARFLAILQQQGDLLFINYKRVKGQYEHVTMQLRYKDESEVKELEDLLGVKIRAKRDAGGRLFSKIMLTSVRDLDVSPVNKQGIVEVPVIFRNFLEVLYALSWGVKTPAADEENGVTITHRLDHKNLPPGIRKSYEDYLKVYCSYTKPSEAYAAVPYRGHWFYIRENDSISKQIFVFADTLFSLESPSVQSAQPLLTLPLPR